MRTTRVARSIERSSRILGLETFDFFLWLGSLSLWSEGRRVAIIFSALLWVALFALRYRRAPGFLLSFVRYHAYALLCDNRFSAAQREAVHGPWLSLRNSR
ncbi:MAG: hypothetical protein IT381_00065 [Deltaproteobacteria bacterium]|nr:hypothetical protein [Deltaproteobacteria bacterium]